MSDYISRELSLKRLDSYAKGIDETDTFGAMLRAIISDIPAADVRPVVRGRWERMSDNDVFGDIHCKCSACGEDWWQGPGWFRRANFCPICGADMREES